MAEGQSPVAADLAEIAATGRLVIYTGAGLSRAQPTEIPGGAEVAQLCYDRLVNMLGVEALEAADPSDLVSVADVVAATDGGLDLVRRTAVAVADFVSARPNFGHEVLAHLLLEGVVVVITTNWDDCIERGGGDERILVVISDEDRVEIQTPALLKVHGCATRPTTALITTDDLSTPKPWARDEVNGRLADSHTVFVGIGDIAGYVRARIEEAAEAVGSAGSIHVVSPGIVDNWDGSQWCDVLPDLPGDRRVAASGDEFLDDFAAACVRRVLWTISEALVDEAAIRERFDLAREGFESGTSLDALRWLRSCAFPRAAGVSATQQQAFAAAMIALGSLAEDGAVDFSSGGRARASDVDYEVLVAIGTVSASRFRREAAARLVLLHSAGAGDSDPVFLVAGALGRVGAGEDLPGDVLDDSSTDDLVGGPLAVSPSLVYAEDHAA